MEFRWTALAPSEVGSGKGPFTINYNSYGQKTIVLVVESDLGCSEIFTKTINVLPCCEDLPNLKINPIAKIRYAMEFRQDPSS